MGKALYTDEQVEWIRENRDKYPNMGTMLLEFNSRYNEAKTLESLYALCKRKKIKKQNGSAHMWETRRMKCGLLATIIKWYSYFDIDVRFENGVIKRHASDYSNFKEGTMTPYRHASKDEFAKIHMHEKRMMKCGYECEIIAIRSSTDIDVSWFDGTITEHRTYQQFESGQIRIPIRSKYLHQKAKMHCGLMAEIIEFFSPHDILVRFEDKYETHSDTVAWNHRCIDNPNCSKKKVKRTIRIGERRMMNSGMWGIIDSYNSIYDIIIRFDDGMTSSKTTYQNYLNGNVAHPLMSVSRHYKSLDFHGYVLEGRVMLTEDDALYKVITPDGEKELMYMSKIIESINDKLKTG